VLFTEKKKEPLENLEEPIGDEVEEEGVAELIIDLRKMIQEYDVIRIVLPETPGERLTTENGSELVFFQEETVS
jgi:hypothetical protein